ncbi:MAG: hypothetical protein HY863_03675 [Chloroflexi bacterium]|nr:hypothetical protein [Chloroflexota bacterium]
MSYKLMFALNAIVSLLVGLVFLIAPERALLQLGTSETYVSTISAMRFVGAALITIALLLWFAKDIADAAIQKKLGFSLLASTVIGLVMVIVASMSKQAVIRSNSWIPVVVFVLFGLGYGFLIFLKPRMKE